MLWASGLFGGGEGTCGVEYIPKRVQDEGEGAKEGDEGEDTCVEESLCRQRVCQLQHWNVLRCCIPVTDVAQQVQNCRQLPCESVILTFDCHSGRVHCDVQTLAYRIANPTAAGRLTHVLRKGIISAPLPGAVTTRTSCENVCVCINIGNKWRFSVTGMYKEGHPM